jgi:hypothetical protein
MYIDRMVTSATADVVVGFLVAAAIVLAVMIGFFIVRWRQHQREVRAGQLTSFRKPNPRRER